MELEVYQKLFSKWNGNWACSISRKLSSSGERFIVNVGSILDFEFMDEHAARTFLETLTPEICELGRNAVHENVLAESQISIAVNKKLVEMHKNV